METGFMGSIYKFSDWLTKFIYVNVLWIVFSFAGLILLGFFPATAGMFSVVRKWVNSESDAPVFKTFWTTYKKEFVKSNILGYVVGVIGYIFYLDLLVAGDAASGSILKLTFYPILFVSIIFLLTALYVFPVFVHFETKLLQVFKNAFLIMITHPIISILMGIGGLTFYLVTYLFPIILPIFGGSGLAFILMWYSNFTFIKVQKQIEDAK